MKVPLLLRAVVALAGLCAGSSVRALELVERDVTNEEQLLAAEKLVNVAPDAALPPVVIRVKAGQYLLKDTFRVTRSRVTLQAEPGARFVLANNVNEPVVALGSQIEAPGKGDTITDIVVMGLEVDGNREQQRSEFSARRPWIRNNGIDVRAVDGLRVSNVAANHNRSGGLVISWGCSDVHVSDSSFAGNFFDGIAFYASRGVEVVGCTMTRNRGAGISLDNEFVDSRFVRCVLEANGDVGVFARSSARLEFRDCIVKQSGSWAYFLSHDPHGRGVVDLVIAGGQITGNRGGVWMASVNEEQSRGTRVIGAAFSANDAGGRRNIFSSGSVVDATQVVGPDGGTRHPLNIATIR